MAGENETTKRPATKKYSEDEVKAMIAEASRKAALEAVEAYKASQPQTVVQVAKDEYVTVLFIGAIASGTTVSMPKWGQINYAGGMLDIPKKEFLQGIGVQVNNALLRERQIIVLSGLTDEERRRFGVDYKEGEYLTDRLSTNSSATTRKRSATSSPNCATSTSASSPRSTSPPTSRSRTSASTATR